MSIREYRKDGKLHFDIRNVGPDGRPFRRRVAAPLPSENASRQWAKGLETEIVRYGEQEESSAPTLEKFSERWIEEHGKADGQKASTIDKKQTHLRVHIIPLIGNLRMDEIDLATIQKFKADLANKKISDKFNPGTTKLSSKSIKNILSDLSSMLGAAVEWQVIESAPHVKQIRAAKPKMEFYELEDYGRLVEAAERIGAVAHAAVLLAGDAGLRRGELEALEHRDIDHIRKIITVERSQWYDVVDVPKGGRSRRIPMTPRLQKAIKAVSGSGRVLGLGPLAIAQTVRRAHLAAKIDGKPGTHKLRHTFGSHLAMAGVPIIVIKELMGHQSIQTTERYMHLAPASEAEGIRALSTLRERGTIGAPNSAA